MIGASVDQQVELSLIIRAVFGQELNRDVASLNINVMIGIDCFGCETQKQSGCERMTGKIALAIGFVTVITLVVQTIVANVFHDRFLVFGNIESV
jgi:hypothetical protein